MSEAELNGEPDPAAVELGDELRLPLVQASAWLPLKQREPDIEPMTASMSSST